MIDLASKCCIVDLWPQNMIEINRKQMCKSLKACGLCSVCGILCLRPGVCSPCEAAACEVVKIASLRIVMGTEEDNVLESVRMASIGKRLRADDNGGGDQRTWGGEEDHTEAGIDVVKGAQSVGREDARAGRAGDGLPFGINREVDEAWR